MELVQNIVEDPTQEEIEKFRESHYAALFSLAAYLVKEKEDQIDQLERSGHPGALEKTYELIDQEGIIYRQILELDPSTISIE